MLIRLKNYLYYPSSIQLELQGKLLKETLFTRYFHNARKCGIKGKYFILSFDCDTVDDEKVVLDIDRKLTDIGIRAVYAVPGEILLKGRATYEQLAEKGAEFINHGFKEHTYYNKKRNRHESCFFYNQLSEAEIEEDILRGHETLQNILGIRAQGFRTPHFGTFQSKRQLTFLHETLSKYKYQYSSSTMPFFGFQYGPAFTEFGLLEIPVSGTWSEPLKILDSWSYLDKDKRLFHGSSYYSEGKKISDLFIEKDSSGLLNYYADPSHIAGSDEFFSTVKAWSSCAANISYRKLLEELGYE